jgi:hypothetical protein
MSISSEYLQVVSSLGEPIQLQVVELPPSTGA